MHFTLSDGGLLPAVGLGTWPMVGDECARVVAAAIDMGYRLIDTAFAYQNEDGVGRGVKAASVPRDDVFITTKFDLRSHSVEGVEQAWADSARKLGVDYIDLMLIHWPNPWADQYLAAWEGLVAIQQQGKVRHIGVSSFLPEHLQRIITATGVAPVLNQMQVNPRYLQAGARAFNATHGIHTQAWSPLGQGTGLLEEPLVVEMAEQYGCTPGQLVLAWDVAQGMSTIPKSSHPQRMAQNLNAASITLSAADVARLATLDGTEPDVKHPNEFGH